MLPSRITTRETSHGEGTHSSPRPPQLPSAPTPSLQKSCCSSFLWFVEDKCPFIPSPTRLSTHTASVTSPRWAPSPLCTLGEAQGRAALPGCVTCRPGHPPPQRQNLHFNRTSLGSLRRALASLACGGDGAALGALPGEKPGSPCSPEGVPDSQNGDEVLGEWLKLVKSHQAPVVSNILRVACSQMPRLHRRW